MIDRNRDYVKNLVGRFVYDVAYLVTDLKA